MKKIVLSVAIVILGIAATSCKKYTCTCYDSNGNATTSSVSGATALSADEKCVAKGSDCSI